MLFNSVQFIYFFLSIFLIYWFFLNKYLKLQNLFILIASYFFYAMWDWRFLLLIAFSSGVGYISAFLIEKYRVADHDDKSVFDISKMVVTINIILNLLILIFFKYCNFFSLSLVKLFHIWGYELDWVTLDILLPIGISFYTFQAIGYTVDVYKQKTKAEKDVINFFAYISFFPKLTAGPIEKSTHLLPQFSKPRYFEYNDMVSGTRQLLWGLFKKLVVADNCALIANNIFDNSSDATGSTLVLGAIMFTFQIYGDFSGYSDMAIGLSRLLGFNLVDNFKFPYFSRDVSEFWTRWHISLNTWFRDYVYIPLGGSRVSKWISVRNTMIVFFLSGLWHGANWTFIIWGVYHGALFLPLLLFGKNKKNRGAIVAEGRIFPNLKETMQMLVTFFLVMFGWIIFRADSITQAIEYIFNIFSVSLFSVPQFSVSIQVVVQSFFGVVLLIFIEWLNRSKRFGLDLYGTKIPRIIRSVLYLLLALIIFYFGGSGQVFIYNQF